jgi:nicotinate phosphoribosyltransferase
MIAHYKKMGIDPRTKTLVFSDGLDIKTAIEIEDYVDNQAKVAFGIGTNLTNDLGYPFLQIVMKMTECNGRPVAKISDTPSKTMCRDNDYVKYLKEAIK